MRISRTVMASLAAITMLAVAAVGVGCDEPEEPNASDNNNSKSAQEKPNAPGNSFLKQLDQVQYQKAKSAFSIETTAASIDFGATAHNLTLVYNVAGDLFDRIVTFMHDSDGPAEQYVAMFAKILDDPVRAGLIKAEYPAVDNFMQTHEDTIRRFCADFSYIATRMIQACP
ncbi:MAG: hypothetical protein VB042_03060 [Victivallaceae bacterium]|nr:hypothetical protein [Victivallaceae bacterium]